MKEEVFKQLPLNGNENDFVNVINELKGYDELYKALNKFYKDNSEYNPRQLHYIICEEANEIQLTELMGKRNKLW
jgi:hypothetical protein